MRQRDELELLNSRIMVVLGAILVAFAILAFGFWRHQIAQSPYYRQLAERNRIRDLPLEAPRGNIYDRELRVIADNRPSWNLILTREDSPRSPEETIAILAEGMDVTEGEMLDRLDRRRSSPEYQSILLYEDLSLADIAFVEARGFELPEISLSFQPRRRYEGAELAAHVLGYVGEVTQDELSGYEFGDRKAGDIVGRFGLERQYDALLQGTDGTRLVLVNNFGREMEVLGELKPVPGKDLVTTLDLDLQRAAEMALGDRTGIAVAILPATGEVLALASRPAFDPTLFARGILPEEWDALVSDPRDPFQNRAIQNRFSPGSVFKIFMTAAALEEHVVTSDVAILCQGGKVFYGNRFDCWSAGHGHVSLLDALVHSCNVFFYTLGDQLGIDRISSYATMMGLGQRTGIDLPGEDAGIMPSAEWKIRTTGERWYPGETISVSIGQGPVSVTPLQLTYAVGGLAVGGVLNQPHLVAPEFLRQAGLEVPALLSETYTVAADTVALVQRALWGVVNDAGTGTRARVDGFDVAGKTGTAQVVRKDAYSAEFEDHAWFIGFAPYDAPEIAVGVFVESGGHGGSAAAPVAQAILQTYFDKKSARLTRNRTPEMARND